MSIAIIPTAIGGAQAAVSSASIIKNILAGLSPSISGLDALTILSKDIGGFEFDYIGEERLEARNEITDHYTESNQFMQDHCAVGPTFITMRGFVAEKSYNRKAIIPTLLALSTALTPVTPYIGAYSPGSAEKMNSIVTQTDQIINQLAQIASIYGSVMKLVNPIASTKVQLAYNKLETLRSGGATFAVVTPWGTFGDTLNSLKGPMMIDSLTIVSPEDTRGVNDIVVRMKEIRVAPSIAALAQDNARGSQASTINGTISASTAGAA